MEQYRTQLYALLERLNGAQEHKRHKDASAVIVKAGAHLLKVRWLKTAQVWRVLSAKGLAARIIGNNDYIGDARACMIAKEIIRAALSS